MEKTKTITAISSLPDTVTFDQLIFITIPIGFGKT